MEKTEAAQNWQVAFFSTAEDVKLSVLCFSDNSYTQRVCECNDWNEVISMEGIHALQQSIMIVVMIYYQEEPDAPFPA